MRFSRKRSQTTRLARATNFESLHQSELLGSFRLAADRCSAAGALEFRAPESRSASSLTTFQEDWPALVRSCRQRLPSGRQSGRRRNALDMDRHARGVRHDRARLRPQGYTFICGHNQGSRSEAIHLRMRTRVSISGSTIFEIRARWSTQDRPTSISEPGGSRSGSTHLKITIDGGQGQECHLKLTVLRRLLRHRRPWYLVNRQETGAIGDDDCVSGVVIRHRVRGDAVERRGGHAAV